MPHQTITPVPPYRSLYRVLTSLQTKSRPKSLVRLKRLSSVKCTLPHSCMVQSFWSLHHCKRCLRCEGVNGMQRTGRRENNPPLCKRLATVNRDILRPVVICSWFAILPAVWRRLLLACRTMYRSFLDVVILGDLHQTF